MRDKLTIIGVKEERKWNDARILDFTATNPAGVMADFTAFGKPELFPHIKAQTTIDAEWNEKPRADGKGINRNLVNIYLDSKPVIEAKSQKGGGYQHHDNTVSIEAQTAIKEIGECWRTGKIKDDDGLVAIYKGWLSAKLGATLTSSKPSSTPDKHQTGDGKAPAPTPPPAEASKPPATEKKAPIEELFPDAAVIDNNPVLTEALKCKDGAELAKFAGKHGVYLNDFQRITNSTPANIKTPEQVQAAAKVLFG